jgi:hypothetical protein
MAECPYCGASIDADDRYCPRCSERQGDRGSREGIFDPAVVAYLDGVRNGARALDPDSEYHQRFETQLSAAVADFAHLAGVGPDLAAALDLDALPEAIDPATEADDQQVLGAAVFLGLLTDAVPEPGADELLAYARRVEDSI